MTDITTKKRNILNHQTLESIFILILTLYPMRHIYWGLDFWDTGYNYANFAYMGLDHMDSMWLFSTYLANAMGHFLMKLPGADVLVGMNLYTGLFVSALALIGYLFCTRKLRMPKWLAFVGEMVAISLCWCPTALLYNYLTYVLYLIAVILLYQGLTKEKMWYLFGAGVCLGTNVLVRFSNLPEAAMIVAVWAYAFIVSRENKKKSSNEKEKGQGAWAIGFRHTLWCLGGYLSALLVLFGYIHLRYGLDAYVAGIQRLFAMTDRATDYKATSMIMGVVGTYVENLYWVIRIAVIIFAGMLVCAVSDFMTDHCKVIAKHSGVSKFFKWSSRAFCVALALAMLLWLYVEYESGSFVWSYRFCSFAFYSYDSMLRPGILFLMLTMFIGMVRIFHPTAPKEEKLISGMLILVVLLTSLGSNNGVYPSINNLFLAAPYTLWQCWRFACKVKEWKVGKLTVSAFPAKCIGAAFIAMFLFQITAFGAVFVFAEATGAQNITSTIDNNEVLKGVKMSPERAQWMREISTYVTANDLQGREVILYGKIPAMSYYLQMPSAFNPWSDLESYSVQQMELDIKTLVAEIDEKGEQKPVVIADSRYADFLPKSIEEAGLMDVADTVEAEKQIVEMEKWILIVNFMDKYGYEKTFENDKFVIWE